MRKTLTLTRTDEGRISYAIYTGGKITERKTLTRPASIQVEDLLMSTDKRTCKTKPRDFAKFITMLAHFVNGV